jgi:putative transcriptional regulator
MKYHYTQSGLEHIWLINGFNIIETAYGQAVSIEDVDGLHSAIGRLLIIQPRKLTGAEFRFLRSELDMSQNDLADCMGATAQQIYRWERSKNGLIPGTADRLIRMIYDARNDGTRPSTWILDVLTKVDESHPTSITLEDTETGWRQAA